MQGKLIVIDGTDGSGKTEQTERLCVRMLKEGLPVKTVSFPRYETPTGAEVKAYLNGKYGPPTEVTAKQASILYTIDRWASLHDSVFAPLDQGTHIVSNRYVASNMGHQGSKFPDAASRTEFFRWNDEIEHGIYGLPRPDLNVILHVPAETSIKLIEIRGNAKDGLENVEHLKRAEATYLELAQTFPGFVLIECMDASGNLLSRSDIHDLIWAEVSKLLALQPA